MYMPTTELNAGMPDQSIWPTTLRVCTFTGFAVSNSAKSTM